MFQRSVRQRKFVSATYDVLGYHYLFRCFKQESHICHVYAVQYYYSDLISILSSDNSVSRCIPLKPILTLTCYNCLNYHFFKLSKSKHSDTSHTNIFLPHASEKALASAKVVSKSHCQLICYMVRYHFRVDWDPQQKGQRVCFGTWVNFHTHTHPPTPTHPHPPPHTHTHKEKVKENKREKDPGLESRVTFAFAKIENGCGCRTLKFQYTSAEFWIHFHPSIYLFSWKCTLFCPNWVIVLFYIIFLKIHTIYGNFIVPFSVMKTHPQLTKINQKAPHRQAHDKNMWPWSSTWPWSMSDPPHRSLLDFCVDSLHG